MKDVLVAAVQMRSELGNVRLNALKMTEWMNMAAASGAHMVVFPECCLTGYSIKHAADVAIDSDDETAASLERRASELGIALGFGYIQRNGISGRPYIVYSVSAFDGRLSYRKAHLGSSERPAFTAGDDLPVAQVCGVYVGVQLCWEGHIPDIASTLRAQGAQLLLAPHAGSLGGPRRIESWCRYLPARALDNGMFVIALNALRPGKQVEQTEGAGREFEQDGKHDVMLETSDTVIDSKTGGGMAAFGPDGRLLHSYDGTDEHLMLVHIGGQLPREIASSDMHGISYFDRRRPELYGDGSRKPTAR